MQQKAAYVDVSELDFEFTSVIKIQTILKIVNIE